MERRSIEMLSSLITIIISILAIAVFILYGGNLFSYALIAIAIIFAMLNAWLISHENSAANAQKSKTGKATKASVPQRHKNRDKKSAQ